MGDAGGVITDLPDTIVDCWLYGQPQQMEMINSISCLADTEECQILDVNQILLDAYELAGIMCRSPTMDDDDTMNRTLIPTTAPSLVPTPFSSSLPTTTLDNIIALSATDTPTVTKSPSAALVPFSENT